MTKKKSRDPYKVLKYVGYRLSQLPNPYDRADLVRYAQFQLAAKTHRLMKDPIWDNYTEEELLMEFFAHQMNESEEFRKEFEVQMGANINGAVDDFDAWADKQMAEEAKIRDKIMGQTEDKISFSPDEDLIGEE